VGGDEAGFLREGRFVVEEEGVLIGRGFRFFGLGLDAFGFGGFGAGLVGGEFGLGVDGVVGFVVHTVEKGEELEREEEESFDI
jgi:hypothetical protein